MSTPQENPNLIPGYDGGRLSDGDILKKLQQFFGVRNRLENFSLMQPSQDQYQAALIKFFTQNYIPNNSTGMINNNIRSTSQMGVPMMQFPFNSNILLGSLLMNQKNSYNYPQFNNLHGHNSSFGQPSFEFLRGGYNQISSCIAQSPHHVYSSEINKENEINITGPYTNLKFNEINNTSKTNIYEKKTEFISKKRTHGNKRETSTKTFKKNVKKVYQSDSSYLSQSENKTEDSLSIVKIEGSKLRKKDYESLESSTDILQEVNTKETSQEVEGMKTEFFISAKDKPEEFMKQHFPIAYLNPDSSPEKDITIKDFVTLKKEFFQYPNFDDQNNKSPKLELANPKKIWTPNGINLDKLDSLMLKINMNWSYESISFDQEMVMEFLMMNKNNMEKTANLIRFKDRTFLEFVNGKKVKSAEIEKITNQNKKSYILRKR